MIKKLFNTIALTLLLHGAFAQKPAMAAYAQIGGPGLASANFDMRFGKREDGAGWRAGIGGFSIGSGLDKTSVVTVPIGLNYLIGKDKKNYFELGAGFTYISATDNSGGGNFSSSFGNLTLGYRHAPEGAGFLFKAEITPVFGSGFFIPYWAGIAFGYKF